jgi:hypothetical protein
LPGSPDGAHRGGPDDPIKAQLLTGINGLATWINTELDNVGDMARQLPFVGGSVGTILDAG